jgi:hypothetical protein
VLSGRAARADCGSGSSAADRKAGRRFDTAEVGVGLRT